MKGVPPQPPGVPTGIEARQRITVTCTNVREAMQPGPHKGGVTDIVQLAHPEPAPCQWGAVQVSLYVTKVLCDIVDLAECPRHALVNVFTKVSCAWWREET